MITTSNFTTAASTYYTAEILENPSYNSDADAAYFQARVNGKDVVRLAMRKGVLNAFLTQADGKATEKPNGGYDFRGLKVTGRGNIGTSRDGLSRFLNFGYITKVEAKADPAPHAEAPAAPKAIAK